MGQKGGRVASSAISKEKTISPTILLVDTDLGFMFWLGQALGDDGYEALPAKSVGDAISLIDQLKIRIDLLIVNASLQRHASLVDRLHRTQEHLKVIAVSADRETPMPKGFDASKSKPLRIDRAAKLEWLDLVRSVLGGADAGSRCSSRLMAPG